MRTAPARDARSVCSRYACLLRERLQACRAERLQNRGDDSGATTPIGCEYAENCVRDYRDRANQRWKNDDPETSKRTLVPRIQQARAVKCTVSRDAKDRENENDGQEMVYELAFHATSLLTKPNVLLLSRRPERQH